MENINDLVTKANYLLSNIHDAVIELQTKGYRKHDIRISAPFFTVGLIDLVMRSLDICDRNRFITCGHNDLFGVDCHFEHPYSEIVVHTINSPINKELLIKIEI